MIDWWRPGDHKAEDLLWIAAGRSENTLRWRTETTDAYSPCFSKITPKDHCYPIVPMSCIMLVYGIDVLNQDFELAAVAESTLCRRRHNDNSTSWAMFWCWSTFSNSTSLLISCNRELWSLILIKEFVSLSHAHGALVTYVPNEQHRPSLIQCHRLSNTILLRWKIHPLCMPSPPCRNLFLLCTYTGAPSWKTE